MAIRLGPVDNREEFLLQLLRDGPAPPRADYDLTRDRAIVEVLERAYVQARAVTVEQAAPLAAEMVEAWHEHLAGFTADEVKRAKAAKTNFAGCAGNSADEYDSSTEGHW